MNARQAIEYNDELVKDMVSQAHTVAKVRNISLVEAIDYIVSVNVKYATNKNAKFAWEIRGERAKKLLNQ